MSLATLPPSEPNSAPTRAHLPLVRVYGELPFHTDGAVLAVAFAADGSLWSVEEPGVLRRWTASSGQPAAWHDLSELETLWTFSPDARLLASASDELSLWDVEGGRLLTTIAQPSWVTAVAFGRDGRHLATGHDDGSVNVWDRATGKRVRDLQNHRLPVSALAFSGDGRRLASAGEDRAISLWEVESGRLAGTLVGHTDRIPAVAWHPQRPRLFSAGWDTTVRVWDTDSCRPVILLNSHAAQVTAIALSGDGSLLASGDSKHTIHLWDTASHRTLAVWKGHAAEIRCLGFSPDGQRLASGGEDRVLYVRRAWEQGSGPSARLNGLTVAHVHTPARLALSTDSARLACTGGDKGLRLWDTAAGQPAAPPEDAGARHVVAFSPDGRLLIAGGEADVAVWDAATGQRRHTLEGPAEPVTVLAIAPDSRLVAGAGASEESVWLWDAENGEPALLIPDALDGCTVEALAFHPQGRQLAVGGIDWMATGGSDGAVSIWDVVDRCELATFGGGVHALAFHPSGRWLAAATLVRSVCIWEVESGRLVTELTGHEDAVTAVAYSPDGRLLASGSDDHTLRLWDAATGACLAVAELDTQVKALCFALDGRTLFTGNGNASCYQLDVQRLLSGASV